jgi:Fe-S cluster assembly iron-binding protein IscA
MMRMSAGRPLLISNVAKRVLSKPSRYPFVKISHLEGGCSIMLSISGQAAERLRGELIRRCFEIGVGFRIAITTDEVGKSTFSIKFDRQHQGDKVIESDGVKVFLDASSAARIKDYQLNYTDDSEDGFFLKILQTAKSKQ